MSTDRLRHAVHYIYLHRHVYTREAIEQQLGDAGYSSEEIEAAWEMVQKGAIPSADEQRVRQHGWAYSNYRQLLRDSPLRNPLFWIGAIALIAFAFAFVLWAQIPFEVALIALAVLLVGVLTLSDSDSLLSLWLRLGLVLAIVVPIVALFIIVGMCVSSLPGF